MLTIGVLTYNSPTTLYNTLLSYYASGLLEFTDDVIVVIHSSEQNLREKKICEDFNIQKIIMTADNTKMAGGIDIIQNNAKYEYILFLECDFRVTYKKKRLYNLLNYSLDLLKNGAHVVRLRSLTNPGHPIQYNLYKEVFNVNEINKNSSDIMRQMYLVTHYIVNPEKNLPNYIKKINDAPITYQMTSKNVVYTNNPHIVSKKFYNEFIKPYVIYGENLESNIDRVWHNYNHDIYITEGCFTHARLDGHIGCDCCHSICGGVALNKCTFKCCDNNELKITKKFEESDLL